MARLEGLGASKGAAALDAAFASYWLPSPLLDGIAVFGNLWPHDDKALEPCTSNQQLIGIGHPQGITAS